MQPDPIGVGNLGALVVRVGLDAVEADAQRAVALIDQQIGADEIGRAQHAAVGERDLEARAVDLKRLDLKRLDLERLDLEGLHGRGIGPGNAGRNGHGGRNGNQRRKPCRAQREINRLGRRHAGPKAGDENGWRRKPGGDENGAAATMATPFVVWLALNAAEVRPRPRGRARRRNWWAVR